MVGAGCPGRVGDQGAVLSDPDPPDVEGWSAIDVELDLELRAFALRPPASVRALLVPATLRFRDR